MTHKILLIDDENMVRELIIKFFENDDHGYEFIEARNPYEGLKLLKEENPKVVVTDIVMPGMSGIEMIEEIRKINKEVKIIIASGKWTAGGENHFNKAKELKVDGIISKPITKNAISLALKRCLG